jgi:hypothetical protein
MEYQTTYNKLPPTTVKFLKRVERHVGYPLYFYGSVQRSDFVPDKSDIDIDIFSKNEQSTIYRVQSLLQIPSNQIKKIACKLNASNTLIYGHKISYTCSKYNMMFEFSIFNTQDKDKMLKYHTSKIAVPYHISILLVILKYMFYTLNIIPKAVFKSWKTFLMNRVSNKSNNSLFIYI